MKVKLRKDPLVEMLGKAVKFQDPNNPLPICENFLIQGDGKSLIVRATDAVSDFKGEIQGGTTDVFSIVINAVRLFQTVKDFRDNIVLINILESHVVLSSEKSKYKIPTLPIDEFPAERDILSSSEMHIKASTLKEMLTNCREFISGKDSFDKLQFTGVYITSENNKAIMVGTDGNAICYGTSDILSMTSFKGIIIDGEICDKAILISGTNESVEITSDGKMVKFVSEIGDNKFTMLSSILEYKYPFESCKKFFSSLPANETVFNSVELRETIKRVSKYSSQESKTVTINMNNEKITVTGEDQNFGISGEEDICLSENRSEIIISFNWNYISKVTHQIEEENLCMLFSTNNKPAFIVPLYGAMKGSEYKYMIAPVLPITKQ